MTAQKSRPAKAANPVEDVSQFTRSIGHTVETQLDAVLFQLIGGEIGLDDLTPALVGWWTLAYDAGRDSMRGRIERLEWLADLYYWLASNKGKTAADYYSHQTSELWRTAVHS